MSDLSGDLFLVAVTSDGYLMHKTADGGMVTIRFRNGSTWPDFISKSDASGAVEWHHNIQYEESPAEADKAEQR